MNDPVTLFLLSIAGIFLIGSIGELIFQRTNIPDVIWLILAGIALGPVAGLVTRPLLASIAPYFAALTLVVVLFEGGTALKLEELRSAASRSSILAACSFTLALVGISLLGAALGLFSERLHEWFGFARFLPEQWGMMHGVLLGTILGGSSSIIIMPAMAAAKVDAKISSLVGLESAVTDALCVVGTAAVVDIMLGSSESAGPLFALASSFGIGAGIGLAAGFVWLLFLRALKDAQHAYPFTLAALLVLYVIIDKSGGSAAFGILSVAVILGNAKLIGRVIGLRDDVELNMHVRGFHAQMAFIVKSFFFVFIGAMLGPPWGGVILGVLMGAALYFLRLPAVKLALMGAQLNRAESQMITVSMPRGMAAGVLATLPVTQGVAGTEPLPVIVFSAVFVSILIFAVGFPIAKRGLQKGGGTTVGVVPPTPTPPAGADAPTTPPQNPMGGSSFELIPTESPPPAQSTQDPE